MGEMTTSKARNPPDTRAMGRVTGRSGVGSRPSCPILPIMTLGMMIRAPISWGNKSNWKPEMISSTGPAVGQRQVVTVRGSAHGYFCPWLRFYPIIRRQIVKYPLISFRRLPCSSPSTFAWLSCRSRTRTPSLASSRASS